MFLHVFVQLFLFFIYFVLLVTEKVVLASKNLFRPANGNYHWFTTMAPEISSAFIKCSFKKQMYAGNILAEVESFEEI